jgi:hypothetical protein
LTDYVDWNPYVVQSYNSFFIKLDGYRHRSDYKPEVGVVLLRGRNKKRQEQSFV